jgi:hypothetical protein
VFKRDGDDPLAHCNSVTTCASTALIQIKADQSTAFSEGSEDLRRIGRAFRAGIPSRAGERQHSYEPLSVHRITLSQTLPCLMSIRAIEKPKSDMMATTVIAPQM